jgi:hypothetical protein
MGGSSGGSEKTTSIQNSEPWKEQTPFLKDGMNEAYRLSVDAKGKVTLAKSIVRR